MITLKERSYSFPRLNYAFVALDNLQKSLKSGLYGAGIVLQKGGGNEELWDSSQSVTSLSLTYNDENKAIVMEEVCLTVSLSKSIVSTQINSLNGTIKEFVGQCDYDITIDGAITSVDGNGRAADVYPTEGVQALVRLCSVNDTIIAASPFLAIFDIRPIVIKKLELIQATGGSNRQGFRIMAVSDVSYNVKEEDI